ncbi:hypothetical protein Pst134EB_001271 [Puccinia striiformis f. sp. tritici]|nr:hypothetical protein Pst134EB_001271 [Puccinia striiformis f. sp. tritici]
MSTLIKTLTPRTRRPLTIPRKKKMAAMPLSCTTTNHSRPPIRLRKGLSPINANGAQSRSASTSPPTQTSKPTVTGHTTVTDYASRAKAIAQGANLPESAEQKDAAKVKKAGPSGTLTNYVQKGRFDVKVMNQILVFWIIRHALPWARFADYLLSVAIDYCNPNARVYTRTWAANQARKLYVTLQRKVINDIKNSESKISLVADVWTTKGNHHAFIGISVCYINKKWEYVSQHLALKFVSWHHNGKYLAAPFANVLIKHQLHNQISLKCSTLFFAIKTKY